MEPKAMKLSYSKDFLKKIPFAVSVKKQLKYFINYQSFTEDLKTYRKLAEKTQNRFSVDWKDLYPCLGDKTTTTGFDRHYIYHPAWAARILARTKPDYHVDISSTLHFCSLISAFIPVKFYDYRPANLDLSDLSSESADLLNLPFKDESILSLSCMHTVEHVGLGRYGDFVDPEGDLRAIAELKRVISPGGSLLFVVPVGRPRIQFNAHRIYSYGQIISYFSGFKLEEYALIPDSSQEGNLIFNATEEMTNLQSYGCGCFWFKKA
jgi:SAM-dependent methyltransferase